MLQLVAQEILLAGQGQQVILACPSPLCWPPETGRTGWLFPRGAEPSSARVAQRGQLNLKNTFFI